MIETLTDPYGARNVAVDQRSGTVAVINDVVYNPVGNVTVYAPGSTTPCANLSFPNMLQLYEGAFDGRGDLYVTGQVFEGNPAIGVIKGGCAATTLTLLKTKGTVGSTEGIAFAPNGNLAVGAGVNILTFRAPVNGALNKPISVTYIEETVGARQFAFTQGGAFIFVVDDNLNKVFKYHYPGGNAPIYSFPTKELNPAGLVLAPVSQ